MGRLAIYLTTILWGSSFVVTKNTIASLPPLWLLAIRLCGATLILLAIYAKRLKNITKSCIKGGCVMGILLICAYLTQIYGLSMTTPGKNAFLMSTYCIMVPFLSWMLFKNKPDKFNIIAAVICFIGIWLVSVKEGSSVNLGDILSLGCGVFFGLHLIYIDKFVKDEDPILLTGIQFAVAGLFFLILAPCIYEFPTNLSSASWVSIAYLCVLCTALCYLLQTVGQQYTPPETVSLILMLESVFGTIFSVIFYHEELSAKTIIGFVLIFISIYISETKLKAFSKKAI